MTAPPRKALVTTILAMSVAAATAGCATNPLRYCPQTLLTREEIATFLARAYSLPLP